MAHDLQRLPMVGCLAADTGVVLTGATIREGPGEAAEARAFGWRCSSTRREKGFVLLPCKR